MALPQAAMALPCEVLPSICAALEAAPAAAAAAAARAWRQAALADNEAWRRRFVDCWRHRQKPSFARPWWHELLAAGATEPAPFALTAPLQPEAPAPASPSWPEPPPQSAAPEQAPSGPVSERERRRRARMRRWLRRGGEAPKPPDQVMPASADTATWHQRFVRAARDLRRTTLTKAELCLDLPLDRRVVSSESDEALEDGRLDRDARREAGHEAAFARRWVLAEGALRTEFLGDELKCNADGSVDPRACLLALVPDPMANWRWRLAGGGQWVVFSMALEGQQGEDDVVIVFTAERARDGGFLLRCPQGLVLCGREKTEEEHIYRCYNILRFPRSLRTEMEELADGKRRTPHAFPPTLTAFERLVVHRLAESLGLRHDSRGVGVQRRIVIWRIEDVAPPEHACPVDGGTGGQGAAAIQEVTEAALAAWRTVVEDVEVALAM